MEKPTNQPQQFNQPHVLFDFTPLDGREDIDDKTQRMYQNLKHMIAGKTDKECHEIYLKHISVNPQHNTEELTMGLLVAILVDQDGQQSKYYRDLVSFTKDSLTLFSTYLNMIIIERLSRLRDYSMKQIFWITNQLMKASINTAENICSNLIRQTAGGDLSNKNLWLVENLLDLLIENRSWLINSTNFMVPTIIYTFMRLIADHMGPNQAALRQKEVDFVIGLIREKFSECLHIGRDFLRLLHNIVRIPEFEKLWQDIYNNPKSLHPSFQNPLTLLTYRTPRRLVQSRLTFEMEKKISFLATQVKFGNQKRYQNWFHKQYLSTPESLSLRCDLIRYICTIIHPSNEVLCSDIIPRWAIIGWLLTTCTTSVSASTSKLTLFFDWLLYDSKVDSIMNIEPAILVMYHSMGSHPTLTASLLDFLCRIPTTFSPKLAEHIKAGIKKSLQQILEKRVVQSLAPLFDNPKHDPALKALIRETFPEFCVNPIGQPIIENEISTHANTLPSTTVSVTSSSPQANHQNLASANHNSPSVIHNPVKQQIDLHNNQEHEKISSQTDPQIHIINLEFRNVSNSNETNNHPNKSGDQPVTLHNSDKTTTELGAVGPSTSGSSSPRDESKAFTWNGNENVNVSYSYKANNDNKNRKSSISITSPVPEPPSKKLKGASNSGDNLNSDTLKNISKLPTTNMIATNSHDFIANEALIRENNSDISSSSVVGGSSIKVIYPFMTVPNLNLKEAINTFDEPIRSILEDLSIERYNQTRCNLMDRLISAVFDNSEQSSTSTLKTLGHCMAYLVIDDFSTRIFPSFSQDNDSLEESISTPFFVLCRSAFSNSRSSWTMRPMSLLATISKFFEGTGFLILYFLRVTSIVNGSSVATGYIDFCNTAKRKLSKCLYDDLFMALTYDSEMFCFLLPSVFGEIAASGSFQVTGNIELIRLVVSAIDPIYLQELLCLCLTGSAKVINKEEIMTLVETSLVWESWEQYCVWKLINAQSVPIENYIDILPKLHSKAHAEARSCILLNLQKVSEPTIAMIQQLIECECKPNDPFVSSILRYWSMKTDTKDLAKSISFLFENYRPSSPQVKRKGQTKATGSKNTSLNSFNEKILQHLDAIRQRAPKNKLLAQPDMLEMISKMETLCNESQRKRFSDLFSNRPKPSKKQKKIDKEITP